ncbi:MAG: glycine zipper family protein [Cellvibrionales bacterium]|nr:MAG: glycine zipper family protein [Cellvibrionales bacterium]
MKKLLAIGITSAFFSLPLYAKVIIDPEGVEMGQYQRDTQSCEQISSQVDSQAGSSAVKGAVLGGGAGAIVGNSDTAKKAAGVGALLGVVGGRRSTSSERDKVIKNCLRNKGYTVLN